MRHARALGLAGCAAVAIGGLALAATHMQVHTVTVRLPGGGTETVRYVGNVAPQISLSRDAAPVVLATPVAAPFDWDAPFAVLDQLSAQMDQQSAAMLREFDGMAAPGAQVATFGIPVMGQGYAFASSLAGQGLCGKSVEITSTGEGKAHVVSKSWGNCGAAPAAKPASPAPHAAEAPGRKVTI
jgi:hypothetical protein